MNNTLTLGAVSLQQSGRYTCTASNEAGNATATARLRVLGERADTVTFDLRPWSSKQAIAAKNQF